MTLDEAPRKRRTAYASGRKEMAQLKPPMGPLEMLTGRKTKRRLTKAGRRKNQETLARTPFRSKHRWMKYKG